MPYILTRLLDGEPVFWTGHRRADGSPEWTLWKHKSKHFSSARAAYEAASTHPELNDTQWRAMKR